MPLAFIALLLLYYLSRLWTQGVVVLIHIQVTATSRLPVCVPGRSVILFDLFKTFPFVLFPHLLSARHGRQIRVL